MRTLLLAALLLSGCAPTLEGSNERGGIITNAARKGQAFDMATAECAKYGRKARVSGTNVLDDTLTYDCVEP